MISSKKYLYPILSGITSIVVLLVLFHHTDPENIKYLKNAVAVLFGITLGIFIHFILKNKELQEIPQGEKDSLFKKSEEIDRLKQELDHFYHIASHDLKGPLRGMRNFAEFLLEDYGEKLDSDGKKYLHSIKNLGERLQGYLGHLVSYSRIDKEKLEKAKVSVKDILGPVTDIVISSADKEIKITHDNDLPIISCDQSKISTIFMNLIQNAVKYNDKNSVHISIAYKALPEGLHQFCLTDNGIGIKKEYWDDIFILFKRLHGGKEYGGGTGAGLALIKKLAIRHNGDVWVEKSDKDGTAICFTIKELL